MTRLQAARGLCIQAALAALPHTSLQVCRLKAVDSEASDEEVEEQFTMQLEQLIKQCEDELGLIPKMAEWKPWDVPADHKVPPHLLTLKSSHDCALCMAVAYGTDHTAAHHGCDALCALT